MGLRWLLLEVITECGLESTERSDDGGSALPEASVDTEDGLINDAHVGLFFKKRLLKLLTCLPVLVATTSAISLFDLTPLKNSASLNLRTSSFVHRTRFFAGAGCCDRRVETSA